MAGGRGKPGGIPLHQRSRPDPARPIVQLHSTVNRPTHHRPGPGRNYGETATYRDLGAPDGARHVFVTTEAGRNPGLLTGWRKPEQLPWEGHVIHPRLHEGRWVLVDEWVLASSIDPA